MRRWAARCSAFTGFVEGPAAGPPPRRPPGQGGPGRARRAPARRLGLRRGRSRHPGSRRRGAGGHRPPVRHLRGHGLGPGGGEGLRSRGPGLPRPPRPGPPRGGLYWKPLGHDHVLFVLHNPRYAGAYFYGRRRQVTDLNGRAPAEGKGSSHARTGPCSSPTPTPATSAWSASSPTRPAWRPTPRPRGEDRRAGPTREGPALLQGLVVCGRCGRRMTVGYHRRCDGSLVPDYSCQQEGIATGTQPCQRICGSGIDDAGGDAGAQGALAVGDRGRGGGQRRTGRPSGGGRPHPGHDGLLRAGPYAAEATRRRYVAVDPTNRLVASTLEADWKPAPARAHRRPGRL